MRFGEKVKMVIFKPSKFFEKIKKEKNFLETLKYYLTISVISSFFVSLILHLTFNLTIPKIEDFLFSVLFLALLSIISSIIGSGIIHVVALLLKGKGNFLASYKSIAYSSTPSLIFGWIPFLGIFFILYSIYLLVVGITRLHKVSTLRAIGIVFLPTFIFILFVIILALLPII